MKSKILAEIETKVDLKEVQQALNDCQNDIVDQLQNFKKTVKTEIHQVESDLYKAMERKCNLLDVQEALAQKADHKEIQQQMVSMSDFQELLFKVDRLAKEVSSKLEVRGK